MSEKTWLDGVIGWTEAGNTIETYWPYDPAIDTQKSDLPRWSQNLEVKHLVVIPGKKPVTIQIRLPEASQLIEIKSRLRVSHEAAAAVAFEICVRFPEWTEDRLVYLGGSWRLPQDFLMALIRNREIQGSEMVEILGTWILKKCLLSEEEKKVLSPDITPKTSETPASTTATPATTGGESSKGARISARRQRAKTA